MLKMPKPIHPTRVKANSPLQKKLMSRMIPNLKRTMILKRKKTERTKAHPIRCAFLLSVIRIP